jgi:hypothetical protein
VVEDAALLLPIGVDADLQDRRSTKVSFRGAPVSTRLSSLMAVRSR